MESIRFKNFKLSMDVNDFIRRVNYFAFQNFYQQVLAECYVFGEYLYHEYEPRENSSSDVNDPMAALIIACIVQQHAYRKLNDDKSEKLNHVIENNLNFIHCEEQKNDLMHVWEIMQNS